MVNFAKKNAWGNFCCIFQKESFAKSSNKNKQEIKQKLLQAFFCSFFRFLYQRGQRVIKNVILQEMRNFYFSSNFDVFFSFDSSQWELSVVCQQIFSISYRFRAKRGQSSGGGGSQFPLIWKNFNFLSDFDAVFSKWFLRKNATKVISIEKRRDMV